MSSIILELRVRNHPGTMSHITGLFSRRAFNLEAIRCSPVGDGLESRMFLLVNKTPRLEQIEYYLLKLHDVLAIHQRCDLTETFFQIEDSAFYCSGSGHLSPSQLSCEKGVLRFKRW